MHLPSTLLALSLPVARAAPPAAPEDARGRLALYCAEECPELELSGFALRTRLPRTATRPVVVLSDVTESWPRPEPGDLSAWGEGEVEGMDQAGQVVLLEWAAPPAEALPRLEQVLGAAAAAASWLEDVDTGRFLGPQPAAALAAAAALEHPDLSQLIVVEVHEDPDGASLLATRGLARLGLPELVDRGEDPDQLGASAARLNAVAQAVFESGLVGVVAVDATRFASTSAALAACELQGSARLEYARGLDGVAGKGPVAELVAFDGAFGTCARGQAVAVAEPEPPPPDPLQQALAAAKARLAGPVKQAFQAGLPEGDRLMVKAPFQGTEGKVHWLWLGVEQWTADDRLVGPLLSKPPQGLGVLQGERVQAELDLVFDYLWRKADGSSEGNETQAWLGG